MDTWLGLARGPFFWTALAIMLAGLCRQFVLTVWEAVRVYRRAGDKDIPLRRVLRETGRWLVPVGRLRQRWPYSLTTFVLHVAVLLVPLFLAGHVELWRQALGIAWPTLPNSVATLLTIALLVATAALLVQRAVQRDSRVLSRFQDYALPVLIAFVFASGCLVMHPAWNPFPFRITLLAHLLAGDALLLLVPLTKLSHMILLPLTHLVSELAWHFPPDAGARVGLALGKEKEPV